jgi:putative ABC transport system permease protein
MVRLILKQTLARLGRLALTVAAVALGVTFVVGTLVLTDTSQQAFDDQFAAAVVGVDLTVRDAVAFDSAMGVEVERDPLPPEVLARVAAIPGVAEAHPEVRGSGLITVDNDPIVPSGPSVLAAWTPPPVGPYSLRAGRAPEHSDEVVVDEATARAHEIRVGDQVQLRADTTESFIVVGLAGFGDQDGLPASTIALVEPSTARRLLALGDGSSEISVVAAEGVAPSVLAERIQAALGSDVNVALARDAAAASAAAAKSQLQYIEVTLLVLAGAALLIGAFLIANTFSIVVTQRVQELALLRAAGATGRQVFASIMGEALAVGLLGWLLGLAAGILAARGLRAVVAGFGVAVTDSGLLVTGRTVAVTLAVGVGVTLFAALGAARRASRVAPVEALRASSTDAAQGVGRTRTVMGALSAVAAIPALVLGSIGDGSIPLVTIGAVAVLASLVLLGPVVTPWVSRLLGRPLLLAGVPGALARQSAGRAPRRSAATATALALSLGLIVTIAVVGASIKASMRDSYREVVSADLIVESARGEMLGGLVPAAYRDLAKLDEVEVVSPIRYGHWKDAGTGGTVRALTAVDPQTLPEVTHLDMVAGNLGRLEDGGIVLAARVAQQRGLEVGDRIPMTFARVGTRELEVVGLMRNDDAQALSTEYLVSLRTYAGLFSERMDASILIRVADGVDVSQAQRAVETALSDLPTVEVRDQAAAVDARTQGVDQIIGMVMVLLLFTVLIAMLGITNTLALSIVERIREIGLLRAVGMTRRQLRATVRAEAALTAVVGLAVGLVLGVGFAWVALSAAGEALAGSVTVPIGLLGVVVALAAVVGLLAGVIPARRAARMEVLAAIAHR